MSIQYKHIQRGFDAWTISVEDYLNDMATQGYRLVAMMPSPQAVAMPMFDLIFETPQKKSNEEEEA